jgi:hypothetical protein
MTAGHDQHAAELGPGIAGPPEVDRERGGYRVSVTRGRTVTVRFGRSNASDPA